MNELLPYEVFTSTRTLILNDRVVNIQVELYNCQAPVHETSVNSWTCNEDISATDIIVTLLVDGMIFGYAGPILPICFIPQHSNERKEFVYNAQKALVR